MSSKLSTSLSEKKQLLKRLNHAQRNYRIAVRWFRDTLSYKNIVGDAWTTGRADELKSDADVAHKEAVAEIFRWRKTINSTRKKLMDLVDKERKENGK